LRGTSSGNNRINQGNNNFSISANFATVNFVALQRDSSTTGAFSYDNTIVTTAANSTIIENSNQFVLRSGATLRQFWGENVFYGCKPYFRKYRFLQRME
jgi:hypothetical protein